MLRIDTLRLLQLVKSSESGSLIKVPAFHSSNISSSILIHSEKGHKRTAIVSISSYGGTLLDPGALPHFIFFTANLISFFLGTTVLILPDVSYSFFRSSTSSCTFQFNTLQNAHTILTIVHYHMSEDMFCFSLNFINLSFLSKTCGLYSFLTFPSFYFSLQGHLSILYDFILRSFSPNDLMEYIFHGVQFCASSSWPRSTLP